MSLVKNVKFANFIKTTLAEDLSAGETDVDITSATGLPSISGDEYFYLTFIRASDNAQEVVKVTAVAGTTLTVTRGQDSTTGITFSSGDTVVLANNAALLDDLRNEIVTQLDKISFADPGATDHQDAAETNTIAKIASDNSDQVLITLGSGTYTFADDYTVPIGVTLRFEGGAQLSVASSKTVTIKGSIVAPNEELFTGSGDVVIASGQDVPAEWYGAVSYATTGEGSPVDSGTKMSEAFDRIGNSRLLLSEGHYYLTSGADIGNGNGAQPSQIVVRPGAYMYRSTTTGTLNLYAEVIANRYTIFKRVSTSAHIYQLMNSTVFPEWFGAIQDNSTDCSAAVEFAMDATAGGSSTFPVIDFGGSANYAVDAGISVTQPHQFRGGTLRLVSGATGDAIFTLSIAAAFAEFEDLYLSSNKSSGNASGIYSNGAQELVIKNCGFYGFRADTYSTGSFSASIYLNDSNRCRIEGCKFWSDDKSSIAFESCDGGLVTDCIIRTPGLTGVHILNSDYITVSNVLVIDSSENGITLEGLSGDTCESCRINSCTIENCTEEGILIEGSTAAVNNVQVQNCHISANDVSFTGVEFRGTVGDATVTGNHIEGFDYGVGTTGATANLLVAVNHLMGCDTETVIHSSSTNTKVLSNMKGAVLSEAHAILVDSRDPSEDGDGGAADTFVARKVNTIKSDTAGMVSSINGTTGEFALVAGTYRIRAVCPVNKAEKTQSRICDVTNSQVVANGLTTVGGGEDASQIGIVSGIVSIGSTTTFKIETVANKTWTPVEAWDASGAVTEGVYTLVEIEKISTLAIPTVDLSGENHVTMEFSFADIGTHKIGELPANAIVTRAWYHVETTFASSSDAATISLGIESVDVAGIVAAIAISDGSNPWDADNHDAIQDGTTANFSNETDEARDVQAIVATENLTAGKLFLHLTFVVNE
jgi:hypothetical protein